MEKQLTAEPKPIIEQEWAQLTEIAEIIGCPVSAFFAGSTGIQRIDDTRELLALWSSIDSCEGRRRVLEAAREVAAMRRRLPS